MRSWPLMAIVLLAALVLSACNAAGEPPAPTNPGIGPGREAMVESVDVLILESFPVQVQAHVRGNLPDGCVELGEPIVEQGGSTFNVSLPTSRLIGALCTDALAPFEVTVPLDVVGLEAGTYTVDVEGVTATFELAVDNVLPPEAGGGDPCLPGVDQAAYTNLESGFCLAYPAGYGVEETAPGMILFTSVPRGDGEEAQLPLLMIDATEAAEGRSAAEIADGIVAEFEGLHPDRSETELVGEPAVQLDGMPGQDLSRLVIAVHGDRVYKLRFVPFGEDAGEHFTEMQALYDVVMGSFNWLPME